MVGLDVTGFKGPLDNIVLKCSFALGSILQCITRLILQYFNIAMYYQANISSVAQLSILLCGELG